MMRMGLSCNLRRVFQLHAPTYPDWGNDVSVGDVNSLKQQRSFCREFREDEARMANVSAPPKGVTSPKGMRSRKGTLLLQEDTFYSQVQWKS